MATWWEERQARVRQAAGIVAYRFQQFTGAYRGNHLRRKLSREIKERYFYPR